MNVRLWHLALSQETTQQNMNANIHGNNPGLIYTWNSTNSKQNNNRPGEPRNGSLASSLNEDILL